MLAIWLPRISGALSIQRKPYNKRLTETALVIGRVKHVFIIEVHSIQRKVGRSHVDEIVPLFEPKDGTCQITARKVCGFDLTKSSPSELAPR